MRAIDYWIDGNDISFSDMVDAWSTIECRPSAIVVQESDLKDEEDYYLTSGLTPVQELARILQLADFD